MTEKSDRKKSRRLKDLPEMERPREKLLRYGASSLSNAELLALLLGNGTRGSSALALAEGLLSSDSSGLLFLNDCTPEELCSIGGIGSAKAAVIIAAAELGRRLTATPREKSGEITSPDQIAPIFMQSMRNLKKESFRVLILNTRNEIISTEVVSTGSLQSAEACPREVFYQPLRRGAASVILVHNHPSGNPEPSAQDLLLTRRLIMAGDILGIKVLDHIVIGDGIYTSMKEESLVEGL